MTWSDQIVEDALCGPYGTNRTSLKEISLGRLTRRCWNNIKMDLKKYKGSVWTGFL